MVPMEIEEPETEEESGKGSVEGHGQYLGPTADYLEAMKKDETIVVPPRLSRVSFAACACRGFRSSHLRVHQIL